MNKKIFCVYKYPIMIYFLDTVQPIFLIRSKTGKVPPPPRRSLITVYFKSKDYEYTKILKKYDLVHIYSRQYFRIIL